jgi:hypothetical protein
MKKVLMLVIASSGEPYDSMKRICLAHYLNCKGPSGAQWLELRFVYGARPAGNARDSGNAGNAANVPVAQDAQDARDLDLVYPQVPDHWLFDKTVLALRDFFDAQSGPGYDYVVRTNLSTLFHWDLLRARLEKLPRRGVYAGCAPSNLGHVSGYCIVMSADVVHALLERDRRHADDGDGTDGRAGKGADGDPSKRQVGDDVWIAHLLMRDAAEPIWPTWLPKLDVWGHGRALFDDAFDSTTSAEDVFVLRHKTDDRTRDIKNMAAVMAQYARGERSVCGLLNAIA